MKNIIFDFDAMAGGKSDKATKKALQMFTRAGLHVVSTAIDAKTKRSNAISYREVSFTFADSQTAAFAVKSTGDIYQVKINGKIMPITEQDDAAKSVQEIAAKLDAGRIKFQALQVKTKIALPEGMKSTRTTQLSNLTAVSDELDGKIQAAQTALSELSELSASNELSGKTATVPQ
jgi:hypothetical protein